MNDGQLIRIFESDWQDLTSEAQELLRTELNKRNLQDRLNPDSNPTSSSTENYDISQQFHKDIIHYVVESKTSNLSKETIMEGLAERGLNEQESEQLIQKMPEYFKEKIQQSNGQFLTGIFLLFGSLALKVLPVTYQRKPAISILITFLLIGGVIKFFHGWLNKRKFEKLIPPSK